MVKPLTDSELASILKLEPPTPPEDALEVHSESLASRSKTVQENNIQEEWV